jgi:hypothetical protein
MQITNDEEPSNSFSVHSWARAGRATTARATIPRARGAPIANGGRAAEARQLNGPNRAEQWGPGRVGRTGTRGAAPEGRGHRPRQCANPPGGAARGGPRPRVRRLRAGAHAATLCTGPGQRGRPRQAGQARAGSAGEGEAPDPRPRGQAGHDPPRLGGRRRCRSDPVYDAGSQRRARPSGRPDRNRGGYRPKQGFSLSVVPRTASASRSTDALPTARASSGPSLNPRRR